MLQSLYQYFGNCTKCTNYNSYSHHFHVPQLFSSLVLIFLFAFFQFVVSRNCKFYYTAGSLFCMTITRSGRLAETRWFVRISKSYRILSISFSWTDYGLCIYYLFVSFNLNFLHNFLWITFPTQSCLVFYSLCANLLHSLIIWLMVSSLSPHNVHLLFCCVLSILSLT